MLKWIKGFIAGISSLTFVILLAIAIFYKVLFENIRERTRHPYRTYEGYSFRGRGDKI